MADRETTTSAHPRTTTRADATNTRTSARATATTSRNATRTTSTRSSTRTGVSTTLTATSTVSPSPTIEAGAGGGSSGAAIGGAVAGVAVVLGLVGFLFYRRKKRSAVAAAKSKNSNMTETRSGNVAISGPMSLAPENGGDAAPAHRPEAQFREQQQFRPGMRDELFAQPGSAIHKNLSSKKENSNNNNNNNNANNNNNNGNNNGNGYGYGNEKEVYSGNRANQNDSYEDNLVNDYYGDNDFQKGQEPIGAQRPAPQPKDITHGNLTPAPEYYMGKEDIDPRRDLRGLDSPESYVKPTPNHVGENSPRNSYSSDRESTYQTLEQAQQAHNQKMMGHKHSIGSVDMLNPDRNHQDNLPKGRANQPAENILSVMTESTVSMMPALPPTAGPGSPHGPKGSAYDAMQRNNNNNRGPPPRGNMGPLSPRSREDPYAESAFSDEYGDDRSLASGYYNGPGNGNGHGYGGNGQGYSQNQYGYNGYPSTPTPPYYPQGGRGPYSPQPMSPPYRQGYPQQHGPPPHGYNNYNGGGGGRPYPGQAGPYPNNRQQYPAQNGPGYQRDGPYRQY